jgi:TPR repeat protein
MKARFLGPCVALALLVGAAGAWAQSRDAAPPAQSKGVDPAVLAKAYAGDAAAQYQVGWYYEHPNAIWSDGYTESGSSPHDYVQAASWYRKAAEQGNADAQYDLGDFYLFGHGVPVDYARGMMWLRKAAEQGYPSAQTDLAHFYLTGKFVPQDYAQAVSWYRKAAERGNPDGQAGLAALYEDGQGVSQSYSEAYFWMSLAAANPELAGVYRYLAEEHSEHRDRIAAHLTKTVLLQTQERVRKWAEDHPSPASLRGLR